MGKLATVFSASAFLVGVAALDQSGAKALYDSQSPFHNVGIHYWLQASDGTRFTERMPSAPTRRFTLHIRSNTGGLLGVWSTSDGAMLPPTYGGYPGHPIQRFAEYVVPGDFRLSQSESDGRVVVLFARSQTEQVREAPDALRKLDRLGKVIHLDGQPSVLTEIDESTGLSVGTYVVNRNGNQPGAALPITR